MWNSLKRWAQLPGTQKWLLAEALVALAMARLAVAFLPFRRIASWLGTPGTETPATVTAEERSIAEAVGWAVGIMGRRVPWHGRWLAQALAATSILRRRGLDGTVSFGVCAGESAGFDPHAWLRICGLRGTTRSSISRLCGTSAFTSSGQQRASRPVLRRKSVPSILYASLIPLPT